MTQPVYVNGKLLEGEVCSHYLNRNLREKRYYKDGLLNGEYCWYREDGTIEQQATFEKGLPVGTVKFWDERGNLKPDSGNMKYCLEFCIHTKKPYGAHDGR